MIRDVAPERADVMDSVVSDTSSLLSSTPAASKLGTFCTIAPLTTVLPSSKAFEALSTFLTPATTAVFGRDASRSSILRPVCPVAPATTTALVDTGDGEGESSAFANAGRRREVAATASVLESTARRVVNAVVIMSSASLSSDDSIGAAKREAAGRRAAVVEMIAGEEGDRKATTEERPSWPRRRRWERAAAIFIVFMSFGLLCWLQCYAER
mmetsp:Transcript_13642/g.33028  ORF Transcript_13642/g.33028 Transcript_13642/m.33028 type:complete len:212 (-) Transcript_13642:24-659(-)